MSKTSSLLLALIFALAPSAAWAGQITSCPNGNYTCTVDSSTACTPSGGWYVCVFTNTDDDTVYSVTDDDETWVWGEASGDDFCCHTGAGTGILPVRIATDDGDDYVYLTFGDYDLEEKSYILTQDGDDHVYGSPYDGCTYPCDKIEVGDGEDHAEGDSGHDLIVAPAYSTDANTFDGGAGSDKIYGGAGIDHIYGGDHRDVLYGGAGADVIFGEDGQDWINGNGGADTVNGGEEDCDEVCGGPGIDTVRGGPGLFDECYECAYDSCNGLECGLTPEGDCPSPPF